MRDPILLHVEDDDATAFLVRLALIEAEVGVEYVRVSDVDAAVLFLQMAEPGVPDHLPSLILLDLNLPRRNGFELLDLIRQTEALHHLRVVILTSSSAESDRKRAALLGADGYVAKPSMFDDYVSMLRRLVPDGSQWRG